MFRSKIGRVFYLTVFSLNVLTFVLIGSLAGLAALGAVPTFTVPFAIGLTIGVYIEWLEPFCIKMNYWMERL